MATKKLSEALAELQKAASVSGLDVRLVVAGQSSTDNAQTITLQQVKNSINITYSLEYDSKSRTITLKDNEGSIVGSVVLPLAEDNTAGVITIDDIKDAIPTADATQKGLLSKEVFANLSSKPSISLDKSSAVINFPKNAIGESNAISLTAATTAKAGVMTSEQVQLLNKLANTETTIDVVSESKDGLMSAEMYKTLKDDTLQPSFGASNVEINYKGIDNTSKSFVLTGATAEQSGIMTTEQAKQLQEVQNKIDSIETNNAMYGVEFDVTISSPTCTRIGSTELHKTLPVQSRMRGCLLDDNGDVVEYLDENDWTSNVRDGSHGQVMVEIPIHYRKFETEGNKRRVLISDVPFTGCHKVPLSYISAYEASVQRSTNKLCSVVNTDVDYRGGSNQSAYDAQSNTLLGRPATSISRTNFRNYARKRKADSTEWNCMTYDLQKTLYWLFVIEYATLNSQAAYNSEPTSEGFKQGGLGAGVTTINSSKWSTFNGYNPFIPCGYTDKLGNNTGVVEYTMPTEYDENNIKVSVPRYRGIENPFGHIWQWTDGVNVQISATEANGGNGLSKVYVCHDPAKFTDSNYDGYSHVGNEARNEGYVKEIIFGEGGEIVPKVCTGGGSTTYFCDYHYTNIPSSGASFRGLLFGGRASNGATAGFASAASYNAPSSACAYFGSRLCFIPRYAKN